MEEDFMKQGSVLSANAKREREEQFRRRMSEYQQKVTDLNREVQDKQKEVLDGFREKLKPCRAEWPNGWNSRPCSIAGAADPLCTSTRRWMCRRR